MVTCIVQSLKLCGGISPATIQLHIVGLKLTYKE